MRVDVQFLLQVPPSQQSNTAARDGFAHVVFLGD